MIELRVTSENPRDIMNQLAEFFGGVAAEVARGRQEIDVPAGDVVEVGPNPSVSPLADKPKRGAGKKKGDASSQTVESTATELNDPIPDLTGKPPEEEKTYTLDDIRGRTKAILDAHGARGNDMPVVVAYVEHLFKPFGIKKAAELKPESFKTFMAASQAYLDGTAKV